ncbi:probable N-acetyltransferase HLS1 [Cornus florida]|uniref:probable N-acetyltransferase HLS1 n=1 Tax=Cornus florida TaxID=4283 RepID=UPI00289D085D|nr:probable N-acetyltransferase HLS1 [Cornus florida]
MRDISHIYGSYIHMFLVSKMAIVKIKIRSYDEEIDRARVEDLERRCEVGPAEHVFLFTDTMGDPICRIRNSPMYNMLVAELDKEIVGVIQGSIKVVTIHKPPKDLAKVGYILGLRVSPLHRRKGIGSRLVHHLVEWFITNQADYAYMATEKDNEASVRLFVDKLGFVKFRSPSILVHPVNNRLYRVSPSVEILKLKKDEAELVYRKFMGSTDFFPQDIDKVLGNEVSLGTWVAYPRGESWSQFGVEGRFPTSWAMVSVWNSGELFKLRIGKAPLSCFLYAKSSRLMERIFPCFKVPALPDFFRPFGFYFMYGVHREGPLSGKLVRTLCHFVHNMARKKCKDCKVIVTEVGSCDSLKLHIPHWKLLSCPEDLWCIKDLKNNNHEEKNHPLRELAKKPATRALFVDPREV